MSHFPLSLAMVCVDCESVFPIERACPACTSTTIYSVDRFLMGRQAAQAAAALISELDTLHVFKGAA